MCPSGGYGWNQGTGALLDGASEEDVMQWFSGEMANDEGNSEARKGSPEEQVRRKKILASAFSCAHPCNVFPVKFFFSNGSNLVRNKFPRVHRSNQAGRRLGKRHLQELLVAMGRGCLRGTNTAEEKVNWLLCEKAAGVCLLCTCCVQEPSGYVAKYRFVLRFAVRSQSRRVFEGLLRAEKLRRFNHDRHG